MSSLSFENPVPLYVAACFSEIMLVVLWYRRRKQALTLLLPPAFCALLAIIAASVETDRERIIIITEEIVEYGNRHDMTSAATYLDEDFDYRGKNREEAIQRAEEGFEIYKINSITITAIRVEVEGDHAEARINTMMKMDDSEFGRESIPVLWNVQWIKRPQGWRILKVEQPAAGRF